MTVAVDADDVVTGFADGFGGVGQDRDGVVRHGDAVIGMVVAESSAQ